MATAPLTEPLSYETVKDYLRVTDDVEQSKIEAMIPRSRLWVEEHTGIALVQRSFTELVTPRGGVVRLSRGPLVSVAVAYMDGDDVAQSFDDVVSSPPSTKLSGSWPATGNGTPFQATYVAGIDAAEVLDARLLGAMLALIEGEYTAGFAYPEDAITAATNCLFYMKFVAP